MKKKRNISLLLCMLLAIGTVFMPCLAADNNPFTDVPADSWYCESVQYAYDHQMIKGTGNGLFSPDATTNRAMIVTILHRLDGSPAEAGETFLDVGSDQWYADAVSWASSKGIVKGYGQGEFRPEVPITREQMAAFMHRYAQYKGYDVSETAALSGFADVSDISGYAVQDLSWANAAGLINGVTKDTLDPQGNASRAQAAAILARFDKKYADAPKPQFDPASIPPYADKASVEVNGNVPYFEDSDLSTVAKIELSELDSLGRCGVAFGCLGPETIAAGERGSIGMVKPTGWHTVRYDFVDGQYLYNRCHLLMWKASSILDDERNLITGTRYMNIEGMLPYEEQLVDMIESTGFHVLYRVTPVFEGDNLLASGVLMEAKSVEDFGKGLQFCVYAYNVQPKVGIDYATGDNWLLENGQEQQNPEAREYVLNVNSMKFHYPDCSSVEKMKPSNRKDVVATRAELIEQGYAPCGICTP